MRGKRKEREGPCRLTDFYSLTGSRSSQDGATSAALSQRRTAAAASMKNPSRQNVSAVQDNGDRSPPSTFNSPVKQRKKLTADSDTVSDSPLDTDSHSDINGFSEKLDAFPPVGQPITDSAIKDMLITFRGTLHHDMSNFMRQIDALGERVDHIENKLSDYTLAHNEVVDANQDLAEKISNMKIKMAGTVPAITM